MKNLINFILSQNFFANYKSNIIFKKKPEDLKIDLFWFQNQQQVV